MTSTNGFADGLPLVIAVTPEVVFDIAENRTTLFDDGRDTKPSAGLGVPGKELRPGVALEPIRRLLALNSRGPTRFSASLRRAWRPHVEMRMPSLVSRLATVSFPRRRLVRSEGIGGKPASTFQCDATRDPEHSFNSL